MSTCDNTPAGIGERSDRDTAGQLDRRTLDREVGTRISASWDNDLLPDLSQGDISQNTFLSLSPSGTAHNMSSYCALTPSIMVQDENRFQSKSPLSARASPPGFRPSYIPTISTEKLNNTTVVVPIRAHHRARAFC